MFINDSINHQTRDLSNKNPEQKPNIINPSNIYLNSHTEDNLKLREWLLMPKKEGKDFNFEIKECLKEDFKEEVLTSVLKAGEYWRIKKMKELKIINPVLLNQYFCEACEQGNLKLFKTLIKLEIDIDAKNKEGCSALYLAIQKNVNSTPPNSSFPAEIGVQSPHLEIIHSLINKGADLNFIDKDGNTPLHTAILVDNPNLEIIKLLIEKGAKLDAVNLQFNTPLHIATYTRCPDLQIVKLLIKKGARLDAVNCQGSIPLHTSIFAPFPNLEIIKLLIEKGAKLDAFTYNGNTPLHAAIRANLEIIKLLIEKGANLDAVNNYGCTLLHAAVLVSNPNLEIIKLLIEKGAKLDAVDNDGYTSLHTAILADNPNLEIIKLLIEKGANLDAVNNNGNTPLHTAVLVNPNLEIIKLLIEKGAKLDAVDNDGDTPLHAAILVSNPNLEIIKLLIEKGAKLDAVNKKNGNTPLHVAFPKKNSNFEIIKLLIEKGAKLDAVDIHDNTPLHCATFADSSNLKNIILLIEKGAKVDPVNKDGQTPLHFAVCKNPNLEIIKFLIEKGAMLDAVANDGYTPFHYVIRADNSNLEIINLFIENGAKLDTIYKDGNTLLHFAIGTAIPNPEIINLLIQKGASVYALNNERESCAWLMKAHGVNLPIALLPRDIEMEMRRLLANSWSINNSCFEGKSLNGGFGKFGLIKNMELFQKFEDYLTSTLNEIPLIQETNNLIKKAYKNTDKNSPEKISSQFHKGKTLIFSSGWKDHGVQVIFINNYMLVVNRGQKRERSSIKVFKIDRNKELDIAHISKIQLADLSAEEGSKFIYTELPASLGYEPTKADPISIVIEKKCQQEDQKIGNCWWLSNKSGILGIMMLENLLKAESESFKSEKKRTKKYKQIADDSYALYKYFSEFSFITLLKEYIERPDDKTERDHLLVKQVAAKLDSKNWRYILKKGEIIKSSNMKYTLKRGKLIPPPNVSPKIKALPLLYKMNEIDSWLNKYKEEFQLDDNFSSKKKTC